MRPPIHKPLGMPVRRQDVRASSRERGYTTAWDKASRYFLTMNPCCYYCRLLGKIEAAVHTDHFNPCEPGSVAFMDSDNFRPACLFHNSQKRDTPGDVYVAKLLAKQGN